MELLFIYGLAAVGKLTIGRELAKLTGFRLFHNHLTVDAVMAVFDFGSEPFINLREQIWLSVFKEAAQQDVSLIFTFSPEQPFGHRLFKMLWMSLSHQEETFCLLN